MMDVGQLWRKRMGDFVKEALGYMRYVANSGTVMFLVFAFIGVAYYYSQLLEKLSRTYPVEWGIALVFSLLLTAGNVRTFLREADLVFLLPVEGRMSRYFRSSIQYTFAIHALYVFLVLLVAWPLYTHRMAERAEPFLLIFVFLLVLKLVNLLGKWQEMRLQERGERLAHMLIRLGANAAVVAVLFTRGFLLESVLAALVFLLVAFFYYRKLRDSYINWEHLVHTEKRMQAKFYSFINQFVDVPHLQHRVRRRSWAAGVADRLAFVQQNTYVYLYSKVFARSDLLPMVLRLTVIGWLIIALIGDDWGKVVAYLIVLSLTAAQLSTLRQYYRYVFWTHIYPIRPEQRIEAVVRVVFVLLLVQAGILYLAILVPFTAGWHMLLAPVLGVLFSYGYTYRMLRKKLYASE
jgi:ABC-2 type transport system permease protein